MSLARNPVIPDIRRRNSAKVQIKPSLAPTAGRRLSFHFHASSFPHGDRCPQQSHILAPDPSGQPAELRRLIAPGRRLSEASEQMAPRPANAKQKIAGQADSEPEILAEAATRLE